MDGQDTSNGKKLPAGIPLYTWGEWGSQWTQGQTVASWRRSRSQCEVPNSPGQSSHYTVLPGVLCMGKWHWGRSPKGLHFSLWNNPILPRASDFLLYLFLLCPVVGEGFDAHPTCWVRGLWTHTGVTSGALISEQLEWGARRQGGETGQPV